MKITSIACPRQMQELIWIGTTLSEPGRTKVEIYGVSKRDVPCMSELSVLDPLRTPEI
jgi:hypothetical protein